MIKKLLFLFSVLFIISNPVFATDNRIISEKQGLLGKKEVLVKNLESDVKLYSLEPLIYGYWQNEKWIICKDNKKLFEAVNDNIVLINRGG